MISRGERWFAQTPCELRFARMVLWNMGISFLGESWFIRVLICKLGVMAFSGEPQFAPTEMV